MCLLWERISKILFQDNPSQNIQSLRGRVLPHSIPRGSMSESRYQIRSRQVAKRNILQRNVIAEREVGSVRPIPISMRQLVAHLLFLSGHKSLSRSSSRSYTV